MEVGQLNEIIIFIVLFFFQLSNLGAVEFLGKFEQGSFILGKTKPGSKVFIDKKKSEFLKKVFLLLV